MKKLIFKDKSFCIFKDKSFCFTGKLAELKRTQAERETRSRGGLTVNTVNKNLDYLVIGSIPAVGWKHGDYGRKIEKALEMQKINSGLPLFLSESDFIEAMGHTQETNSGEIDAKIVICKYHFIAEPGSFNEEALYDWLELLQQTKECNISVIFEDTYYLKIFSESLDFDDDIVSITCRIVKQLDLENDSQQFVDDLAVGFEDIEGIDGTLNLSEKIEGSAGYLRFIKDIPQFERRT